MIDEENRGLKESDRRIWRILREMIFILFLLASYIRIVGLRLSDSLVAGHPLTLRQLAVVLAWYTVGAAIATTLYLLAEAWWKRRTENHQIRQVNNRHIADRGDVT